MRVANSKQIMRIKIVIAFTFFGYTTIQSQDVKLGVKGGINFSNQKIETEVWDLSGETDTKIGWQLGVVGEIPLGRSSFTLQPGLMLISKGYTYEENNVFFDGTLTANPVYINIPIPLLYNFNIGKLSFFAGAGFYLSYGIAGEIDFDGESGDFDFGRDDDIKWGDDRDEDTYTSFDAGLVFTTGFKLNKKMQIDISYEAGLANILPDGDNDNKIKNSSFTINYTYFFGLW